MSVLDEIVARRREDVAQAAAAIPAMLLSELAALRQHHSLVARLRTEGVHVIAEMKQASPSAGVLQPEYDPVALALSYTGNGAQAISVLTEPHYFGGSGDHLAAVRAVCDVPLLRKDFMVDPYQMLEAAAWGADVVLLIVAALEDGPLQELYAAAREQGLDVLAEAHTAPELERALALPEAIVGVNSRDLKRLTTNLGVARSLAAEIPADRLAVAESGIKSAADVAGLKALGYRGFLVGESIVGAGDPGQALRALIHGGGAT